MRLSELIGERGEALPAITIDGLTADSREIRPGYLFAALPGSKVHGAAFAAQAVRNGAVAILTDPEHAQCADAVTVLTDENPRRRFALIAARFYDRQPSHVVAVTGTSGKTSVANFARQLWTALGHRAGSIGTLGIIAPDFSTYLQHTTPDPVALHRALAELAQRSVERLAIEASSHGLDQYRLDGIRIEAAAFTNLGRDHMDYHPTIEAYLQAKLRLFDALLPPGGVAVINADSDQFGAVAAVCARRAQRVVSYGRAGRDIRILEIAPHGHGQSVEVEAFGRRARFELPLIGAFQVGNALAAFGLVAAVEGEDLDLDLLSRLEGVPGRMQLAATHPSGAPIYVDYAHKPDALENVLQALRAHTKGRLVVAFGCGGDRDRGKRPIMGEIASRLADRVIVTDDNPRSEDAGAIRAAILAAAPGAREIADRGEAIDQAVRGLARDDVLVIAGKGHENGQIVGKEVRPFNDVEVARASVHRLDRG